MSEIFPPGIISSDALMVSMRWSFGFSVRMHKGIIGSRLQQHFQLEVPYAPYPLRRAGPHRASLMPINGTLANNAGRSFRAQNVPEGEPYIAHGPQAHHELTR